MSQFGDIGDLYWTRNLRGASVSRDVHAMVKAVSGRFRARKAPAVKHPLNPRLTATLGPDADQVPMAAAAALPAPSGEKLRVNVDFTVEMLAAIDTAAARLGVPRQSYIKMQFAHLLGLEKR